MGRTFPDGPASSTVSVTVSDGDNTGTDSIEVTVANVAPVVALTGPEPGTPYQVGTPVTFTRAAVPQHESRGAAVGSVLDASRCESCSCRRVAVAYGA